MVRHSLLRSTALLLILLAAACTGSGDPVSTAVSTPAAAVPTGTTAGGQAADVDPQLLAELQAELKRVLAARGITLDDDGRSVGKAVSSLPERDWRSPMRADDIPTGKVNLGWEYYMKGDYDWNGEVNVSDVTPVGVHFGKTTASPDWQLARRADGDGNGEVNVSDITPIGQNFAAKLSGYVVQWKNLATADWSDFGFAPFDAQLVQQFDGEMGYSAPGVTFANEFRIAPVGETREFSWTNYQLDDNSGTFHSAVLAVRDGIPGIAFIDVDAGKLMYGEARTAHPLSASDWDIVQLDSGETAAQQPQLRYVDGEPAIAYTGVHPSIAFDLRYARVTQFDPPAVTAQWHAIDGPLPNDPASLELVDGRPVVGYAGASWVRLYVTTEKYPSAQPDWTYIDVEAGVNHPSIAMIGNFLNIASYKPGDPAVLYFDRAQIHYPAGPADFVSFPLNDMGGSAYRPSLAQVGGYPCIAYENQLTSAVEYLRPADTKPNSAASWYLHPLFSDPSDTSNPCLTLLDGRPAVAFGRFDLNFAWADREVPEQPDDWLVSEELNGEVNFNTYPPSIVVVDGLPIIAYTMYDAPNSQRHVFIAVASEK